MSYRDPFPLTFNEHEMREYLTLWGYTIVKRTEPFCRNVYHNDLEDYTKEIEVVLKDGVEIPSTSWDRERGYTIRWAFQTALKERLLKVLTS